MISGNKNFCKKNNFWPKKYLPKNIFLLKILPKKIVWEKVFWRNKISGE